MNSDVQINKINFSKNFTKSAVNGKLEHLQALTLQSVNEGQISYEANVKVSKFAAQYLDYPNFDV